MSKRKTTEQFIKEAKEAHGDRYDYRDSKYITAHAKVVIYCPVHEKYTQSASHHLSGRGCPKCAREGLFDLLRLNTEQFIERARSVHGDTYDYSKTEYTLNKNKLIITCREHGDFLQKANNHLSGFGCLYCARKNTAISNTKSKEEFVKKANKVHEKGEFIYEDGVYRGGKKKIKIKCKNGHVFYRIPNNHLKGQRCPCCKYVASKGESKIIKTLRTLNVDFIPQKTFEDCKDINQLLFDFYLPDYNLLIEYHGKQHYKPIKFFGGKKKFAKQQRRDKIKKDYALNNRIHFLEIPYTEKNNIEDIVLERLIQIMPQV